MDLVFDEVIVRDFVLHEFFLRPVESCGFPLIEEWRIDDGFAAARYPQLWNDGCQKWK